MKSSTSADEADPIFLRDMLSLLRQGKQDELRRLARRHGLAASVSMALQSHDESEGARRKQRAKLLRQLYLWLENERDPTVHRWSEKLLERRLEFIRLRFLPRMARIIEALPSSVQGLVITAVVPFILCLAVFLGVTSFFFPITRKWRDRWMDTRTSYH